MKYLITYLLFINIVTALMFLIDKIKAKKKISRISEKSLFVFSFLGGWCGGWLAMIAFHHKVKKPAFIYRMIFYTILSFIVMFSLIYYFKIK